MANEIYREIFVTREEYTPPIQYVQAANAIPIVARICDYNIPSGAKANVYVKKPSGKSVQDTAVIDGNTVTIDVKTQMFVEIGMSIMQIQITNGQDVLVTFDLPVMVRKNRTEPGAPESENEAAFFTELQEAANKARIAAQEANNAAQAAEDALSVLEGAVEGTIINDDTPSDVTTFSGRHIENTFLKKNGDGGNVIVTFQQAAERAGIESGDSLAVAFGKLAKFFTDIQSYVFSPPVNNLLSTDTSRPLSAAMGKQLQEAVESVNSALTEDEKFLPPKASQNTFSNLLQIDTSGSYNIDQMKPGCVATEDASELSGSPVTEGAFYAWRELFWIPNASKNGGGKCIVRLTEAYPIAGRIWITAYNTDISEWSQWAKIMPSS